MLRKNILVIISNNNNSEEFKGWVEKIFHLENLDIFVFDENLSKLDSKLITADYIINFLSNNDKYEYVQKKIELLKIDFFGNNLMNVKLFSKKNNFKKIIQQSKFQTPVFEKINNRNALELFNNFPQPSRIFSKENNYFSNQISSLQDLENVLVKDNNFGDYTIEEFIDGVEIYVFTFMIDNQRIIFAVKNNNGVFEKIEMKLNENIKKDVGELIEYGGIEEFALFNLIYSEKRGLYFLNIFLKNNILFKYKDILDNILSVHKYKSLKEIFKKDLF